MTQQHDHPIHNLVNALKGIFHEQLISVCVYGSAVKHVLAPQPKQKHPNINVIVILSSLALADLEKASDIVKQWEKIGHSLPIFMSEEEWYRSNDVFALEYADIRDNHTVVYGKDVFSTVEIIPDALRLICELELHRKLIFLRQRLLLHKNQPKVLLELLNTHFSTFMSVFRGVLRLRYEPDQMPSTDEAILRALEVLVSGFDATPFIQILEAKEQKRTIPKERAHSLFNRFIQQANLITAFVDQCFGFINTKEGVV